MSESAIHFINPLKPIKQTTLDLGDAISHAFHSLSADKTTAIILDVVRIIGLIEPVLKAFLAKDPTAQDIFKLVEMTGILTPPDFGNRPLTPEEREGWLRAVARSFAKKELEAQLAKTTLEIAGEAISSVTHIPDSYIDAAIQILYTVVHNALAKQPTPATVLA